MKTGSCLQILRCRKQCTIYTFNICRMHQTHIICVSEWMPKCNCFSFCLLLCALLQWAVIFVKVMNEFAHSILHFTCERVLQRSQSHCFPRERSMCWSKLCAVAFTSHRDQRRRRGNLLTATCNVAKRVGLSSFSSGNKGKEWKSNRWWTKPKFCPTIFLC